MTPRDPVATWAVVVVCMNFASIWFLAAFHAWNSRRLFRDTHVTKAAAVQAANLSAAAGDRLEAAVVELKAAAADAVAQINATAADAIDAAATLAATPPPEPRRPLDDRA